MTAYKSPLIAANEPLMHSETKAPLMPVKEPLKH